MEKIHSFWSSLVFFKFLTKNQKMKRNPEEMTPIFLLTYPQAPAMAKVSTRTAEATMGEVGLSLASEL